MLVLNIIGPKGVGEGLGEALGPGDGDGVGVGIDNAAPAA